MSVAPEEINKSVGKSKTKSISELNSEKDDDFINIFSLPKSVRMALSPLDTNGFTHTVFLSFLFFLLDQTRTSSFVVRCTGTV
jgi:hypothetical protein